MVRDYSDPGISLFHTKLIQINRRHKTSLGCDGGCRNLQMNNQSGFRHNIDFFAIQKPSTPKSVGKENVLSVPCLSSLLPLPVFYLSFLPAFLLLLLLLTWIITTTSSLGRLFLPYSLSLRCGALDRERWTERKEETMTIR